MMFQRAETSMAQVGANTCHGCHLLLKRFTILSNPMKDMCGRKSVC